MRLSVLNNVLEKYPQTIHVRTDGTGSVRILRLTRVSGSPSKEPLVLHAINPENGGTITFRKHDNLKWRRTFPDPQTDEPVHSSCELLYIITGINVRTITD